MELDLLRTAVHGSRTPALALGQKLAARRKRVQSVLVISEIICPVLESDLGMITKTTLAEFPVTHREE